MVSHPSHFLIAYVLKELEVCTKNVFGRVALESLSKSSQFLIARCNAAGPTALELHITFEPDKH